MHWQSLHDDIRWIWCYDNHWQSQPSNFNLQRLGLMSARRALFASLDWYTGNWWDTREPSLDPDIAFLRSWDAMLPKRSQHGGTRWNTVGHGARSRGSSVGKLVERFESAHGAHGEAKRCGWFKKTQEHYYIYNIYIYTYTLYLSAVFIICFCSKFGKGLRWVGM